MNEFMILALQLHSYVILFSVARRVCVYNQHRDLLECLTSSFVAPFSLLAPPPILAHSLFSGVSGQHQ